MIEKFRLKIVGTSITRLKEKKKKTFKCLDKIFNATQNYFIDLEAMVNKVVNIWCQAF